MAPRGDGQPVPGASVPSARISRSPCLHEGVSSVLVRQGSKCRVTRDSVHSSSQHHDFRCPRTPHRPDRFPRLAGAICRRRTSSGSPGTARLPAAGGPLYGDRIPNRERRPYTLPGRVAIARFSDSTAGSTGSEISSSERGRSDTRFERRFRTVRRGKSRPGESPGPGPISVGQAERNAGRPQRRDGTTNFEEEEDAGRRTPLSHDMA